MSMPGTTQCLGRTGRFVPWSFGESFVCSTCGARVRQSHLVAPITVDGDHEAIYPLPAHERQSS